MTVRAGRLSIATTCMYSDTRPDLTVKGSGADGGKYVRDTNKVFDSVGSDPAKVNVCGGHVAFGNTQPHANDEVTTGREERGQAGTRFDLRTGRGFNCVSRGGRVRPAVRLGIEVVPLLFEVSCLSLFFSLFPSCFLCVLKLGQLWGGAVGPRGTAPWDTVGPPWNTLWDTLWYIAWDTSCGICPTARDPRTLSRVSGVAVGRTRPAWDMQSQCRVYPTSLWWRWWGPHVGVPLGYGFSCGTVGHCGTSYNDVEPPWDTPWDMPP